MAVARRAAVALILACAGVPADAGDAAVTPLQKVLSLLGDMSSKGKASKHEEEVEFAKFQQFCVGTREATTKSIDEASGHIEQLSADVAKGEADAEELATEISELEASVAQQEAELETATELRAKERADYSSAHKDLSESVDAVERAIAVLKSREADVPASLMQVQDMAGLPREAKAAIRSFLALASGDEDAPKANAYESQSGGIVGMLENLLIKFQDQKLTLEKEEMNGKANFEMLAQKLSDNIKDSKRRTSEKTATKAQKLEDAAVAKGDLSTTQAGKAEDEKKLDDTLTSCQSRSQEFEKNQVLRAEEIKAIEQAMEILGSDEVSGAADEHLPALLQLGSKRGTALVQLRGAESPEDAQKREHLIAFLKGRASSIGSRYLSLLATHAHADPFGKIKQMVKDLIVKLMEEANGEADQKAYCDTELATNKQTRDNKQSEVEELAAGVDKHEAESAQLTQQLAELSDALGELRKEQAEATELRSKDKATNTAAIQDAKTAQVAVERATKVLKDFYGKADEASFIQGSAGIGQEMSEASKEPYTGMQSERGGIVGFLEVILSDFARLETETTTAEDKAQAAYEKFMDESGEDIAVKETESSHKADKKQEVDATTGSLKKELALTQEELSAALEYFEKLKHECVDNGLSYADRVRMREEEIQSLQEALQILDQQDMA